MVAYQVWEASLYDPDGTIIATFDTREEAAEYVRVHDDESLYAGYGLFVVPASDK